MSTDDVISASSTAVHEIAMTGIVWRCQANMRLLLVCKVQAFAAL